MGDTGRIADLLAEHDGVVTASEARACGLTGAQVAGRLRRGEWIAVARGVYRAATHPPTERLLVRSAVAAHRGVADRTTAAWWHGLLAELPTPLTIASRRPVRRERWPLGGVDLVRRDYPRTQVVAVQGLPVTSIPLTVLLTADDLRDGAAFLDRVLQTRSVDLAALHRAADLCTGLRGMRAARRLLAVASGDSESEAERLFLTLLRDAAVTGWVQQFRIGGRRLDFAWPQQQVAVEIDGWAFHRGHDRFAADHEKRNMLEALDWRCLAFTWHQLVDEPFTCLSTLVALLEGRAR